MQAYTGPRDSPPIVPVPRTVFLFRNNIVGGYNYITQERITNILANGALVEPSSVTDYDAAYLAKNRFKFKPVTDQYSFDTTQVLYNVYGLNTLAFRSTPDFDRYMVDYIYRRRGGIVLTDGPIPTIDPWLSDIVTEYGMSILLRREGFLWQTDPPDILTIEFSTLSTGPKKLSVKISIPTLNYIIAGEALEKTIWYFNTAEADPWGPGFNEVRMEDGFATFRFDPAPVNMLDDGHIRIPMGDMVFNFFGQRRDLYWNSNNAITFGLMSQQDQERTISLSRTTIPAVLLGNYDRILKSFHSLTREGPKFSVTEILVEFFNYYMDDTTIAPSYTWIIKLIKENVGPKRQYIEVSTGPNQLPDAGYSSARENYPSGRGIDSKKVPIDQSKISPFNITNGTTFLNPCGQTFSTAAPPANSSFVFWSDSTGRDWSFVDKAHVRL
jgi:hypothetical protein